MSTSLKYWRLLLSFLLFSFLLFERFFPLVLPIPDYHSKTCPQKLTRENVTEKNFFWKAPMKVWSNLKSPLKSSHTKKYLPNFLTQNIPELKISNPKKSFNHPCHLKSGVPPPPPPPPGIKLKRYLLRKCHDTLLLKSTGLSDAKEHVSIIEGEASQSHIHTPLT